MKNHVKVYFNHFNLCDQSIILCEKCGDKAIDIHHIKYRSQGGNDNIENLIALCRDCHNKAHFKESPYLTEQEAQQIHNGFLNLK